MSTNSRLNNSWTTPGSMMHDTPRTLAGGFGEQPVLEMARGFSSPSSRFGSVKTAGLTGFGSINQRVIAEGFKNGDRFHVPKLVGREFSSQVYQDSKIAKDRSYRAPPPAQRGRGSRGGRRVRGRPSHCFHCGQHGHIVKLCPTKIQLEKGDRIESGKSAVNPGKIENPRESYYNALRYSRTNESSFNRSTTNPPAKKTDEEFSKQLDNALKISELKLKSTKNCESTPCKNTATTSSLATPQRLASPSKAPIFRTSTPKIPTRRSLFHGNEVTPIGNGSPPKSAIFGTGDVKGGAPKLPKNELVTIETRRSVLKDGDFQFEEQTTISFPRNLPDNVRVITALMPDKKP